MTSAHRNPVLATAAPVPDHCGVAFKEWAGVCSALAEGRQALILRKGGIAENQGGFAPEHPAFWLYPTQVHQAEQGLREPRPGATSWPADQVAIEALAVVSGVAYLDRAEMLPALADGHVWTEATVLKRFRYRTPGLWVLGVRVYRRPEPITVAVTPEHAGCKTWVTLDPPLDASGLAPVLDETEFQRRMEQLGKALSSK